MTDERHFGPIWFIRGPNKGRYPNCHSIYIQEAGILIDPASDRKRLESLKRENGVKLILLSHAHEDHFTHMDLFDDVPLWASAADGPLLTNADRLLDSYGASGEMRDLFRNILKEQFNFRPRKPDRLLKDGDLIDGGGLTIQALHTPGHTPGHLSFLFSEPRILFLGDYDLTSFGPWYGDAFSSIEETIKSVLRLLFNQ
jgi:hydroxyacylglutathione hydrolase